MQFDLIAIGRRMPAWIDSAFCEYSKRLPESINFNLIEVAPATRSKNKNSEQLKKIEEEKINAVIAPGNIVIALDEKGKTISSHFLSLQLQTWMDDQQHLSILIGGADGLSSSIKKKADQIWSLSEMTLPHGLVRIIMIEQLYRAWSIINCHPYHRK
tara:strand:- start:788 stop:1258 length:471 start_codon:yes stop_codon:yes gene_type:complete